MKKVLAVLLLTLASVPAMAQHWHGHGGYYRGPAVVYRDNWVAPLILGGVVGAAIANRPTTQTETVIVQQPQTVFVQRQPVCTEWKEIQMPDGQIYRERTCTQ
jgi:hypothetical protein